MNRNPVLKLGIRENYHEQSVNFRKKQVQIIKIFGCIVESVFKCRSHPLTYQKK